jgi:hypothetical protein
MRCNVYINQGVSNQMDSLFKLFKLSKRPEQPLFAYISPKPSAITPN